MPTRSFKLDEASVVLPRGTRVCLRVDLRGDDGYMHKTASVAVVREVSGHTYSLETPSGKTLSAQRDQITLQRQDLLEDLGIRQWDFRRLEREVIYSAVVGSHAWGLATAESDEDVRGCFIAPFEDSSGLWEMPDEVQHPTGDAAYWEVAKLVEQGLRGDANTLETLWSPLHREVTLLGEELLSRRRMFVSMNILGSFGRYAQSQFKKIERSLKRDDAVRAFLDDIAARRIDDAQGAARVLRKFGIASSDGQAKKEVHAVSRSLFDRGLLSGADFGSIVTAVQEGRKEELVPSIYRPKNAYNLLRLLHSCISWMRAGEPLIGVQEPLRTRLMDIKQQRVPIDKVVAEAKTLAAELDEAAQSAKLPERPDYESADEFLKMCRREAARRVLAIPKGPAAATQASPLPDDSWAYEQLPVPLPPDVNVDDLRAFFDAQFESLEHGRIIWIGLTGSHTYGFPSPDSDLDLKGVHVLPAAALLGLREPALSKDFLGDWRGREYDLTLNEIGKAARLVLTGNGNMIERLLGPMPLLTTPVGRQLATLAKGALSQRVANHYRGFFRGMRREAEVQKRDDKLTAKTLLYGYRVALTGSHLLRSGDLITDVRPLAEEADYDMVKELVAEKSKAEYEIVPGEVYDKVLGDFDSLEQRLEVALEESSLPPRPTNEDALEEFVVACRLRLS